MLIEHLSSHISVTNRNKVIVTNDEEIIINTENLSKMIEQLTLSMRPLTTQTIIYINKYIKYFFWVTKHIARN